MRDIVAADILELWEAGLRQQPLDRALTLLTAVFPERSREQLAALSIGRRDAQLLEFRERIFGGRLDAFAECPRCAARLELSFAAAEIKPVEQPASDSLQVTAAETTVRFRLPATADLAAVVAAPDIPIACEMLLQRCLLGAERNGVAVVPTELSVEIRDEIGRSMANADPAADVLLDLRCPSCAHGWQVFFDIAAFVWTELTAYAHRLLRDVAALARAYHWREVDIVAMTPERRQAYLELVGQ